MITTDIVSSMQFRRKKRIFIYLYIYVHLRLKYIYIYIYIQILFISHFTKMCLLLSGIFNLAFVFQNQYNYKMYQVFFLLTICALNIHSIIWGDVIMNYNKYLLVNNMKHLQELKQSMGHWLNIHICNCYADVHCHQTHNPLSVIQTEKQIF